MAEAPAGCPSDETIVGLVEGALGPQELGAVEAHLAGCGRCRAVVAQAVRLAGPTEEDRPDGAPDERGADQGTAAQGSLREGMRIGRYAIRAPVGAGSGGVVYAAWDPELRRAVAIKLLTPDSGGAGSSRTARRDLLREAQAMARLSHPNVVNVHDAGSLGESVFVVMELVEGETLARWLGQRPRAWREVLGAFLEAGRGLAAAHAAGIVHRDFKPDNVLLGSDGRVRVTDFGLARMSRAPDTPGPVLAGPAAPDPAVTALAGTPAFMAPEQLAGGAPDARADQFSFCVALAWAIYGQHPLGSPAWFERARAAGAAPAVATTPPADAPPGVPAWLWPPIARGLAQDPGRRHPSMQDLLAALEAVAERGRSAGRRIAVAGGLVVVAAAVIAGVLGLRAGGGGQQSRLAAAPPAVCGDGRVAADEQCDDGNRADDDGCLASCRWARCGDGRVRRGVEECDDGNRADGDACSSRCLLCRAGHASYTWGENGHCYSRHDEPRPWSAAEAECETLGGALVTYTSASEARALREALLGARGPSWLGLRADGDAAAPFAWVTGEPFEATGRWAAGEPREACAQESGGAADEGTASRMRTAPCARALPFVCEQRGWKFRYTNNHAYRVYYRPLPWEAAQAACRALGGHLVTITEPEEQSFVAATGMTAFWSGARAPEGARTYRWVTGEPFEYRAFAPGENTQPAGEACAAFGADELWHTRGCAEELPWMCEVD